MSDCERIVNIALDHRYLLSVSQAEDVWSEVSEMYAAGWLFLPDSDDELWADIEAFLIGKYPRVCIG